jgi:hypothetical protein
MYIPRRFTGLLSRRYGAKSQITRRCGPRDLWRLHHSTARADILAADEPEPVDAPPLLVTTGLDPVVHADSLHTR